ncbi:MAG: phosphotransferase family protein [Myxococcales bacterium]|nr:phosphotransferase family protein [Myxococcales bacterium]
MSEHPSPPGIDTEAVESWIAERSGTLTPPFRWIRLEGGHSNLTYRVEDANGREAVVRRPPEGKLLPKAHDMGREWKIISALAPTPVPVAPPIAYCEDPTVTGAHFYVMGCVPGRALYEGADVIDAVPEASRRPLSFSFIDVLAELHALDPDAIGLGDLGRPDAYVARQLKRWYGSWESSRDAAQIDLPVVDALHKLLSARVPEQESGRVVHGDYGLHNCLASADGRIAAVLDWEISTLGDPLADLAYALNTWSEPGDKITLKDDAPTDQPGFATRAEMLSRYAERSGRDVSGIAYYTAFNFWKTACIIQGVYARYKQGQKSTEGIDLDYLRERVVRSAKLADDAASALA